LTYLYTAGFLGDIDFDQLPLTLEQLQNALWTDARRGLFSQANPTEKTILKALISTYFLNDTLLHQQLSAKPRNLPTSAACAPNIIIGGQGDLLYRNEPQAKWYPQLHTWGMLSITPHFSLVNVMTVDPYASENPLYVGKEWRGLSGYTEQAYFLWTKELGQSPNRFLRLTGGRSYFMYGPGRTGQLLFSDAARPLDNFKVDFQVKRLSYQSAFAKLDAVNGNARYLAAHRLSYHTRRFSIGLTEALLYGGKGRSVEWAYLNPLLLFHGENVNGPSLAGNTLGAVDFRYCGNNWQLYGEFLVDDIQFDKKEPGDLEPNEIGGILGVHITDPFKIAGLYCGAEVVAITNRTYKTVENYEWFIHRNVPLGYAAGSDLARLNLLLRKYWRDWRFSCEYDYWLKGEGEMNIPWDSPWDTCSVAQGYHEKFPTGKVEYTDRISLQVEWLRSYNWNLFVGVGYQQVMNKEHTARKVSNLIFNLGLHWNFYFNKVF